MKHGTTNLFKEIASGQDTTNERNKPQKEKNKQAKKCKKKGGEEKVGQQESKFSQY